MVNLHGIKVGRPEAGSGAIKRSNGMGTGIIVDPRGYVITNHHVVDHITDLQVTMYDGSRTRAELIAEDPPSDLALVQIVSPTGEPLPTIPRGRSDDLMIGETVIAIGNAYGYVHTSTQGIISALHRDIPVNEIQHYRDLIQTSAGINPGNSGGPLLNIDGDIIGINVAVRVGAQQIAFAIPIDQALQTVASMIERHNERERSLGLTAADNSSQAAGDRSTGYRVRRVIAGSLAHRAGLRAGDELLSVAGTSLQTAVDARLTAALTVMSLPTRATLPVQFARGDETFETTLRPGRSVAPDPSMNATEAMIWQVVGVRVQTINASLNASLRDTYRGGLRITTVREGSEAQRTGLKPGDLLMGLHGWETISVSDLATILNQDEVRRASSSKYDIVRDNQTYSGDLQLSLPPAIAVAGGSRRR